MSTYNKPYLTHQKQLSLLISRGMSVTNEESAIKYLERIGYYRLSAYWYPFRRMIGNSPIPKRLDEFTHDTQFKTIVDLYVFDKKLRLLLLDAIERIEIAVRSSISYFLGAKDPFAHTNVNLLHGNFTKKINKKFHETAYSVWCKKLKNLTERTQEDFVRHYKEKYGLPLPIWVSIELWDFGMLSTFYKGMKVSGKIAIAAEYKVNENISIQSIGFPLNWLEHSIWP